MSAVLILAVAVAAVVVGIILRRRRGSQTASGPGAGPADATLRDEPGVLLSGAPVPLSRG